MNISFAAFAVVFVLVNDLNRANALAGGRSTGGGGFGPKPVFIHTADTGEKSQKLLQFLKAQNAKGFENIDIGFNNNTGRRGLFCTKNIKKKQKFCIIPSDCALTLADPSKNGEDAPTPAHRGANLLEWYMKKEEAKQLWKPYFDTLPSQDSIMFDRTPDFFNDEELELLEFPRIINRVKQRKKEIEEVATERGLSVEELQFATWLSTSRQFKLYLPTPTDIDEKGRIISKVGKKKAIQVLVPFLDIANHSSDQPNCKLSLIDPDKDEAWFALEAIKPIPAGKELVITYGNSLSSSVELFQNYGFVPKSNKIDALMLKKGGDDTIADLNGWTTTLDEDKTMVEMAKDDPTLEKILQFRIRLKESY